MGLQEILDFFSESSETRGSDDSSVINLGNLLKARDAEAKRYIEVMLTKKDRDRSKNCELLCDNCGKQDLICGYVFSEAPDFYEVFWKGCKNCFYLELRIAYSSWINRKGSCIFCDRKCL